MIHIHHIHVSLLQVPFKTPFLPLAPSLSPFTLHLSRGSAFKPSFVALGSAGDRRPILDPSLLPPPPSPPTVQQPIAERLDLPAYRIDDALRLNQPMAERAEHKPTVIDVPQPITEKPPIAIANAPGSAFSPPKKLVKDILSDIPKPVVTEITPAAQNIPRITSTTILTDTYNNNNCLKAESEESKCNNNNILQVSTLSQSSHKTKHENDSSTHSKS